MDNPIFVFGCRRSGTTLMLNCLNHHKNIGLFPGETHYFQRHLGGYKRRGKRPPLQQSEFSLQSFRDALKRNWKGVLKTNAYADYFLNDLWFANVCGHNIIDAKKAYHSAISNLPEKGYYEKKFFENFLKEISSQQKANVWGEKSPMHIFYLDKLREWFPNARFIQLVRDPRSTACSHVYRAVKNSDININPKFAFLHITFPRLLKRWKETSQIGMKNRNENDYFIVKFEDLLLKPKGTLQNLCFNLDIPYNNEMMNINVYHSSYADKQEGFDKAKIETWKEKLPIFGNTIIKELCKEEMRYYDYE